MKQIAVATFVALMSITTAESLYTFGGPKGGNIITPSFAAIEANRFTLGGVNKLVTHLANEADFLSTGPREVALWDATSGAILASTFISTSDALESGYRYRNISPVVLLAGHTYVLGALHVAGVNGRYLHDTNTAILPAGLLDRGTVYRAASSIQSGTNWASSPPRHYVANLKLTPVPEPASLATLVLGFILILRRHRNARVSTVCCQATGMLS